MHTCTSHSHTHTYLQHHILPTPAGLRSRVVGCGCYRPFSITLSMLVAATHRLASYRRHSALYVPTSGLMVMSAPTRSQTKPKIRATTSFKFLRRVSGLTPDRMLFLVRLRSHHCTRVPVFTSSTTVSSSSALPPSHNNTPKQQKHTQKLASSPILNSGL